MSSDGTSYTIGKLLNAQKVTCIHHSSIHFRLNDKLVIINDFECNNKEELLIFLRYVLHTRFKWFMYSLEGIVFTKDKIEDIIKDDVLTYEKWYKELLYSHPLSARKVMPCLDKYKELEVDIHSGDFTFSGYGLTYPKMICPYIRKGHDFFHDDALLYYDVDDKVIDYVYNKRKDKHVTREKIVETYKIFEKDFRNIVEKVNEEERVKRSKS